MTTLKTESRKPAKPSAGKRRRSRRRGWKFYVLIGLGVPFLILSALTIYFYRSFSQQIDARLHGETVRADPRIFARPFELHRGQALTPTQIVERLNDLGYSHRAKTQEPGEFTVGRDAVVMIPRDGDRKGQLVRVVFGARRAKASEPGTIDRVELPGTKKTTEHLTLDPPLITALVTTGREKRRDVPLSAIPQRMLQAVLAIEDRRFYDHPGIDPIGITSALIGNVFGSKKYLRGGSTITQQLVKNTFLTPEKTPRRKVSEWFMSVALERRLSKDQILTLYLNDVSLGQRGSFAIHGVPEASRLFFSKDVTNVTLSEAATIAGVIQSPSRLSPFNNPARAVERRNVVLQAMADSGYISAEAAARATREPLQLAPRALDAEAPYFVDYVSQELQDKYKTIATGAIDVYTTLDLHMQRVAQDAVRDGLVKVDEVLARRKRQRAQAALIAVDPRTGDVLALIGGRTYNQSQFNRVISASRQPGSVFKPFVFLAAFERAFAEGRTDLTPASVVMDEPTSFIFNDQTWTPANYDGQYRGPHHAAPGARPLAQYRDGEGGGSGRVPSGRGPVAARRRGHGAAPLSVDCARGLRSHTVSNRERLYALSKRRHVETAAGHLEDRERGEGRQHPDGVIEECRAPGYDVPRHEHDAERHQRGHRRPGAGGRLHARCRRQVGHDERPSRRVVRRIHSRAADRRLGGSRRQHAARPERHPGRAPHLDDLHEARAGRPAQPVVRRARRARLCRYRPRHRQRRGARLPEDVPRVLSPGYRADRHLPRPRIVDEPKLEAGSRKR